MTDRVKGKSALLCLLGFAAAFAAAFLCGRMVISDTVLAPIRPDYSDTSPLYSLLSMARSGRKSALQLLVIYLAGYSPFALPAAAIVCAYRGAALGYTVSLFASGRLLLAGNIPYTPIPKHGAVFILYSATLLPLICFSTRAAGALYSLEDGEHGAKRRYTKYFLISVGITAVCDTVRGLIC